MGLYRIPTKKSTFLEKGQDKRLQVSMGSKLGNKWSRLVCACPVCMDFLSSSWSWSSLGRGFKAVLILTSFSFSQVKGSSEKVLLCFSSADFHLPPAQNHLYDKVAFGVAYPGLLSFCHPSCYIYYVLHALLFLVLNLWLVVWFHICKYLLNNI